ncbi:hypothetical protein [[Ruminococcus] torques]|uniref:hypothetical protein n=1 Tax=[Ruminococcus] torques TaxID=33039 RepID=UPI003FEE8553
MKKRSLKIMSVVLAGVMTTGMILGGCSAGGDKENGGNKEASKELNLWMHNGQAFVDETKKLAENYEKETGVKINIQTFPYDAMSQKMKADKVCSDFSGSERSVAKISRSRYGGKSNRYETHYCKNADRAVFLCKQSGSISKRFLGICSWR